MLTNFARRQWRHLSGMINKYNLSPGKVLKNSVRRCGSSQFSELDKSHHRQSAPHITIPAQRPVPAVVCRQRRTRSACSSPEIRLRGMQTNENMLMLFGSFKCVARRRCHAAVASRAPDSSPLAFCRDPGSRYALFSSKLDLLVEHDSDRGPSSPAVTVVWLSHKEVMQYVLSVVHRWWRWFKVLARLKWRGMGGRH